MDCVQRKIRGNALPVALIVDKVEQSDGLAYTAIHVSVQQYRGRQHVWLSG